MSAAVGQHDRLKRWLAPFQILFTQPTWQRVLVLAAGAILTTHRRTVAAALRVTGRGEDAGFSRYHDVLSRSRWSARTGAGLLLGRLVARFVPAGPVVIGLDDTIERRWGAKIAARDIYRDPVRSSHGHFVKASGLRWLSAMLLVPVPWARRVWALPFLTVLMPSQRWADRHGVRHKSLVDGARQMLLQVARWLPDRRIVAVADSGFSAIDLLDAVRAHVCVVTRLRLDARLFAPSAPRRSGTRGRPGGPANGSRRWHSASLIRPLCGRRMSSPIGTARVSGVSNSLPAARYGATRADQSSRSAGSSSVIPPTGSGHRPSCPRTPIPSPPTCSPGSSAAGRSR